MQNFRVIAGLTATAAVGVATSVISIPTLALVGALIFALTSIRDSIIENIIILVERRRMIEAPKPSFPKGEEGDALRLGPAHLYLADYYPLDENPDGIDRAVYNPGAAPVNSCMKKTATDTPVGEASRRIQFK